MSRPAPPPQDDYKVVKTKENRQGRQERQEAKNANCGFSLFLQNFSLASMAKRQSRDSTTTIVHCICCDRPPAAETTEKKGAFQETRRIWVDLDNAALSIHRLKSNSDIPVQAAADYIAWSPDIGILLLNS